MNYGLYLSASGVTANMHRMDVLSGNLANAETPGYKPISTAFRQRLSAREEDGLEYLPSNAMLERLGGGLMLMPAQVSRAQGAPEITGRALDLAIEGEGYLVVQAPAGDRGAGPGEPTLRLTRDGRLTLAPGGQLVQAASGLPVLDRSDKPIVLRGDAEVEIDSSGLIRQRGVAVAQIQVTQVPDPSRLRPAGEGTFSAPAQQIDARRRATGVVRHKAIERSAVDPVKTMVDIASAERAVGSNARMIQLHDQLLERAVNTLGRVA